MGCTYKPTTTKPLPDGAEFFTRRGERFARWTDAKGKKRTAPVTVPTKSKHAGQARIVVESGCYVAKFRDGGGVVRVVPTGCHDQTAAQGVLGELERRGELVKAGVVTATEDAIAEHKGKAMSEHVKGYLVHLMAKGVSPHHHRNVKLQLERVVKDCGFATLANIDRSALERWLVQRQAEGMSARTRNTYLAALSGFVRWCVETGRILVNPLGVVSKADERADVRRSRRALTEDELVRLLSVARRRPLQDAMMIRRGKRKGETVAKLSDETRSRLKRIGWERALIYKTLVLSGLRKNELASLTVGQLDLDRPMAYATLHAADEKNRKGAEIPIRGDLTADIIEWLSAKLERHQRAVFASTGQIPARLPADTPLFDIPTGLIQILDRDLVAAGIARIVKDETGRRRIAKRDERGRTIDVHGFRTTFATHLSRGGVSLRTTQAAMRHSTPTLTANSYTDPRLLDIGAALNALPRLPLNAGDDTEAEILQATGTDDVTARKAKSDAARPGISQKCQNPFVPGFVPTTVHSSVSRSIPDKTVPPSRRGEWSGESAVSVVADVACASVTSLGTTAGDATRTRNVQLGRLMLYH